MPWSKKFRELKLSDEKQVTEARMFAAEMLIKAAEEGGGWLDLARIRIMQAILGPSQRQNQAPRVPAGSGRDAKRNRYCARFWPDGSNPAFDNAARRANVPQHLWLSGHIRLLAIAKAIHWLQRKSAGDQFWQFPQSAQLADCPPVSTCSPARASVSRIWFRYPRSRGDRRRRDHRLLLGGVPGSKIPDRLTREQSRCRRTAVNQS